MKSSIESSPLPKEPIKIPEFFEQDLFKKYADHREKDNVVKHIFSSLEASWDNLTSQEKKEITNLTEGMFKKLEAYHETYIILQQAASRRRRLHITDIKKFADRVEAADRRERIFHNAFLDSLNILSRKMRTLGIDNTWRGNSSIYSPSEHETREKTREWMIKVWSIKESVH